MIVEAAFSIVVLSFAIGMVMEIGIRTSRELVLHRAAFIGARSTVIGLPPEHCRVRAKRVIAQHFHRRAGTHVRVWQDNTPQKAEFATFNRFPQILGFDRDRGWKHHMEVTRRCTFPWSH